MLSNCVKSLVGHATLHAARMPLSCEEPGNYAASSARIFGCLKAPANLGIHSQALCALNSETVGLRTHLRFALVSVLVV